MKNWLIFGLLIAGLTASAFGQSQPYRSNKTVKGYRITPLYVKATSPEDSLRQAAPEALDETQPIALRAQAPLPTTAPGSPEQWQEIQQQLQAIQAQLAALPQEQKPSPAPKKSPAPVLVEEEEMLAAVDSVIGEEQEEIPGGESVLSEREVVIEKEVIQTGRRDTILVQNQVFLNSGTQSQDSMLRQLFLRQEQLQSRWEQWMEQQAAARMAEPEPEAKPESEPSPKRITIRTTTQDPEPVPVITTMAPQQMESLEQQQMALFDSLRLWKQELKAVQAAPGPGSYPPASMVMPSSVAVMDSTGAVDSLRLDQSGDTTFYYSDPVALYQLSVLQSEIAELKRLMNQQAAPAVVPVRQEADSSQHAAMAQLSDMMKQLNASQQATSTEQQATIAALRQQLARQDSLSQLPVDQPKGWKGLRMARVFFAKGQSTLQAQDRLELEEMALLLREQTDLAVEIRGFADKSGNPALNQRLSQQRASSVQTYLQSLGIATERMKVVFFGDEKASYGGELDRRVEVVLVE
ncbi:MAG: OmpA family protein [Bacteroidota bacterium]